MKEIRIDMREQTPEEQAQGVKEVQLCFKLNNTMPFTKDYDELVHEIFGEFGEGSRLMAPTSVVRGKNVKIGKNVVIQTNSLFMSAGGITIEDDVLVSPLVRMPLSGQEP